MDKNICECLQSRHERISERNCDVYKKNLSTKNSPACARTRIPRAHVHERWPGSIEAPSPAWAPSARHQVKQSRQTRTLVDCSGMEVRSIAGLSVTHLKDPRAIQKVKQEGESVANSLAILVTKPNDFQIIRYAVIASRSVGGAVQRNRCRRRLRARAVENLKRLEVSLDCVLIARKRLLYAEPREVDTAVQDLFNRVCNRTIKNE